MDIEGLGFSLAEALVNSGMVKTPADLYRLDAQTVATLDRMGKKSAENLINEIEKEQAAGSPRLLCAFGIRQVGQKAAKVLARTFGSMDAIENATPLELTAVDDIGPITAESVVSWAQNPQTQHQIRMLREVGVNMLSREEAPRQPLPWQNVPFLPARSRSIRATRRAPSLNPLAARRHPRSPKDIVRPRGEAAGQAGQGAYAWHPRHHGG